MSLSFSIANRFIIKNWWQSVGIALGIAVGISVQIFVGILIDSLQQSLINAAVGTSAQVSVTKASGSISDYNKVKSVISKESGVTKIDKEYIGNGLLLTKDKTYPLQLRGKQYDNNDIYQLSDRLEIGRMPDNGEIVLGTNLVEQIGAQTGDAIKYARADGEVSDLKISGIFDSKIAAINNGVGYATLDTAWKVFGDIGQYSSVNIQLNDPFKANSVADSIKRSLGEGYEVDNWKSQNAQLLSGLQGQSTSSTMIQVFVLISVLIAITSILSITVTQKSRQIGILKAIGLKDGTSSGIFYFQGLLLGFAGTVLGVILGLVLFWSFVTFAKTPGGESIVEPYIRWNMVFVTAAVSLVVSSLAGIIPARKANKLSPIEVIRNA